MCSSVLNKAFSHFWTSFMVWEYLRVLHACMVTVLSLALVSAFLLCWAQPVLHLGPSGSTNTARSACLMQTERFMYPLDTQIWEISLREICILTSFGVLAVYCSTFPAPHSLLLDSLATQHILSASKCFASSGCWISRHFLICPHWLGWMKLYKRLELCIQDLWRISKSKCRFWGSDLECGH